MPPVREELTETSDYRRFHGICFKSVCLDHGPVEGCLNTVFHWNGLRARLLTRAEQKPEKKKNEEKTGFIAGIIAGIVHDTGYGFRCGYHRPGAR